MKILKKQPADISDIKEFINSIDFNLPNDFITFYTESNGAEILTDDEHYISLWPLTNLIELNIGYNVHEYAPDYFIFGSDGGDMAYCIEKTTGSIFEIPFIGMSNSEAIFSCRLLKDLFEEN